LLQECEVLKSFVIVVRNKL